MSRHGYIDDLDPLTLGQWRGRVASAIRGARGQRLLRDLREALDAMPEKRLISQKMVDDDEAVCALGCVWRHRGVDGLSEVDSSEHDVIGRALDIAPCLVQEIEFINDDWGDCETPESRWRTVSRWVDENLRAETTWAESDE